MASSLLRHSRSRRLALMRSQELFPSFPDCQQRSINKPFLAAILVSLAIILAPESPLQQAAICERHNPVQACFVW